ncbi:MAG: hypothetical protein QQN55_08720 [Nitrosopumilus sp.]
MNRYRATIYVDFFEDDIELAKEEANRIIRKIYDSFVSEVKRLPHGSENILRKENEI